MTIVSDLADETLDWMAESPADREDVTDRVWSLALATYVEGRRVTPRGFDVTPEVPR